MRKVDDEHSDRYKEVYHRDSPHNNAMYPPRTEDLGEKNDDGVFRNREGHNARDERDERVVNRLRRIFGFEGVEVSASPIADRDRGKTDI